MSDIDIKCAHCGEELVADDRFAGQTKPCPVCKQQVTIPASQPTQPILKASRPEDPPQPCTPPLPVLPIPCAGFWMRFAAVFLDALILLIPQAVLSFLLASSYVDHLNTSDSVQAFLGFNIGARLAAIAMAWIYFATFESSKFQATPGKMALGIIVTDLNGQQVSFGQASRRFFGKILSSIPFGLGFLVQPFTKRRQAWHDMLANCLVLSKSQAVQAVASTHLPEAPKAKLGYWGEMKKNDPEYFLGVIILAAIGTVAVGMLILMYSSEINLWANETIDRCSGWTILKGTSIAERAAWQDRNPHRRSSHYPYEVYYQIEYTLGGKRISNKAGKIIYRGSKIKLYRIADDVEPDSVVEGATEIELHRAVEPSEILTPY